jgi:hypothetical protein
MPSSVLKSDLSLCISQLIYSYVVTSYFILVSLPKLLYHLHHSQPLDPFILVLFQQWYRVVYTCGIGIIGTLSV